MIKLDTKKAKEILTKIRRAKRDQAYIPIDGGSIYAVLNELGDSVRKAVKAQDDALQAEIEAIEDGLVDLDSEVAQELEAIAKKL
jgi:hypothetical protein